MLVSMGEPEDADPAQDWRASGVCWVVEPVIHVSVRSV
jgi:hypothetical protein